MPPNHQPIEDGEKCYCGRCELPHVRFQENRGLAPESHPKPDFAEVAHNPRTNNHSKEFRDGSAQDTRGDHEEFHRHRNGDQGRDKDGQQTITKKPDPETHGAAAWGGTQQELLPTAASGVKENHVAHRGTEHGNTGTPPDYRRTINGNNDEQGVEHRRNGYAGGIQYGEEKDTERAPGDKDLGQMTEQTLMLPRSGLIRPPTDRARKHTCCSSQTRGIS